MTPDKLREEARIANRLGHNIWADIFRTYAAALEEIERLKVERDDALTAAKAEASGADKWRQTAHEAERDLQFVERWANHHSVKPNIAAEEVLSVIQHYPPIRAITEGYADGKIPDTPNPWERAERLMVHAEAMAAADSCATYEDVANELRAAVMAYRAEFKGE